MAVKPSLANDELKVAVGLYQASSASLAALNKKPMPAQLPSAKQAAGAGGVAQLARDEGDEELERKYKELKAKTVTQGMTVKTLKKEGKPFEAELKVLLDLKAQVEEVEKEIAKKTPRFDVEGLQNLLTRRMVVIPAFEIHGGVGGLMDFGPPGVGLKDNIVEEWKRHFIVREGMLQVETTNITPHSVLLASGHVDRFTDLLVEELDENGQKTGEYHRADKLLEAHLEKLIETTDDEAEKDALRKLMNSADSLSEEEMDATIVKYNVVGPVTKRKVSKCQPFNLMFATTIGPSGLAKAYLRPETAQGIFVNFKRLLEYNNGKMPFASAQVGTGFRNEIAPKGGLIRVREFTMAEIEHFVHPERKQHSRFHEVKDVVLQLFTADAQTTTFEMEHITVGDAVAQGKINNETLAYFMARSQQFFVKIGVDPKRLRFRQHLKTEMAHYASDCYDAEILLAQGWLECAGHADRACYDLDQHSKATKIELKASEKLDVPRVDKYVKLEPVKKVIGATYKQKAAQIISFFESLKESEAVKLDEELTAKGKVTVSLANGEKVEVARDAAKLIRGEVKVNEERYVPSVIEPSFGIGRIVYSVLEHSYWVRQGEEEQEQQQNKDGPRDLTVLVRNVLSLKPNIAPVKCGIIPHGASFDVDLARRVQQAMNEAALNCNTDASSAAIGRKYARFDEIGVPFVVTLDDRTGQDNSATVRERDSEEQVRVPLEDCVELVRKLCYGPMSWEDAKAKYPVELRPGQKQ